MNLIRLNIQRFAAEASISATIQSQSVANNTSVVRLTYSVKRTSGSTYWSDAKTITFTCDGQTINKTLKFPSSSTSVSVSADFTIAHNSNGTKTISYSAKNSVSSSVNLSPNPVSGTKTLTTIPRASDIDSVSNTTLGNACNVKWTPKATSFQYKITFSIGKWSYTTGFIKPNTTSQYTYTGYTIPLDVANQITTSSSGAITTTLTSYNGTTEIGTSTKSFTAGVPNNASTQPTITGISYSEANQDVIDTNWGIYLKNKSQLNVSYTTNGQYGASVKTTSITIGGNAYTNKATLTTSGNLIITAFDSRNYSNSVSSGTITLVDYEKPKITTALCNRCLEDGTNDDNGEYLKYTFIGQVSPVDNKNTAIFKIRYKESTQSDYTDVDLTATNFKIEDNEQILTNSDGTKIQFSSDVAYNIQFVANDTLGTATTQNAQLETGADLINFNASGKSIAFGKVSEASDDEELMEINLQTKLYQKMTLSEYGMQTNHSAGFFYDQYGNMIHQRTNTGDYFQIKNNAENKILKYWPETGNLEVTGSLTVWGNTDTPLGDYIRCTLSADTTGSGSTVTTLNFGTKYSNQGSRLTISGGKIVVGDNVRAVRVYVHFYFYSGVSGSGPSALIYKNSTITCTSNFGTLPSNYVHRSCASTFNVGKGDVIKVDCAWSGVLKAYNHGTYLIVEVIK